MFSVFSYVVGVLYEYEKNPYSGIEVNFEELGLYYEPEYGSNWWSYYCEPIAIGDKTHSKIKQFNIDEYSHYSLYTEFRLSRRQVFDIIQKYIKIQEPIQRKVDEFVRENFLGHHIISVHYRGTDKYLEAPKVSFDQVSNTIKEYVAAQQLFNYRIFVASDEQEFITQMEKTFPDRVIYTHCERSTNGKPLHYGRAKQDHYQMGEDALIDCLLLSRGNYLIRSSSNLSLWSTYFNPTIPVFELNRRKGK